MNQRRADQPGHERSVLNRVPKPPAAPAKFVVGPETAKRDPTSQKHPGDCGPWSRPARPRRIQFAANQRGDRERKGHRESHVTHVKHRRMRNHRRVLQQRIQVAAIGRHGKQTLERIRREQHEQQKSDADRCHHAEHPRDHFVGKVIAEQGHCHHPNRQHERPEQKRSFVRTPSCG